MTFINTLYNLWPNGDAKIPGLRDGIAASAPAVFAKYGIDSPKLVAHVMAQISHECGAGHEVVENLNYTAGRMMQVWPQRFPTMAAAAPYAGNPRALANKVYNGRMGNASGSDDGWNSAAEARRRLPAAKAMPGSPRRPASTSSTIPICSTIHNISWNAGSPISSCAAACHSPRPTTSSTSRDG
jgi:hypothetical protein